MEFNELEAKLFIQMIDYFIQAEEKEIWELEQPSGNKNLISGCQNRLTAYKAIKEKVSKAFSFAK